MSIGSNRAEVRDGTEEPSAARHHARAEIWPAEARALLAVIVVAMAIGLLSMCRRPESSSPKAFAVAPKLVLDANSAPPQVLEALPTLGPTLVRRWVAARAQRPILSLADARKRVRGLGPASLAQIAPYLKFESQAVPPADGVAPAVATASKGESTEMAAIDGERVDRVVGLR